MEGLAAELRADLANAMRAQDRTTERVLRTVLSAIANAEAQLDEHDTLVVLTAERDERLASADALAARGATEAAEDLRTEAAVIDRYLV